MAKRKSAARKTATKSSKTSSKKTTGKIVRKTKSSTSATEQIRASLAGEIAKLKGAVGGPFGGAHSDSKNLSKEDGKSRKLVDLELVRRLARAVYSRADKVRQSIWNEVTQHRNEEALLGKASKLEESKDSETSAKV